MKQLTQEEWDKIQRSLSKLDALEAGGVDSWEWYDDSLKDWFKENEIDYELEEFVEYVRDLLVDAEVDQPAGTGCGYSITINEESLKSRALRFANIISDIKSRGE